MQGGDRVRVRDRNLDAQRRVWRVTDISGHVGQDTDDRRITIRCGNTHLSLHVSRIEPVGDQ